MRTSKEILDAIEEHIGYVHEGKYEDDDEAIERAWLDIFGLAKEGLELIGCKVKH